MSPYVWLCENVYYVCVRMFVHVYVRVCVRVCMGLKHVLTIT